MALMGMWGGRAALAALICCAMGCGGEDEGGLSASFTGPTAASTTVAPQTSTGSEQTSGSTSSDDSGSTTSVDPSEGATTTGSSESSTGEPLPPFSCDAADAASPLLAGLVLFDPEQPHPGDTVTVVVRATNGLGRPDAPAMTLTAEGAAGTSEHAPQTIEGGEAIYYYAIPNVQLGDLCVQGLVDGALEVAGRTTVSPRPADPPATNGVFKVVTNHQWTCDEQPNNGNELDVRVRDETGAPIAGAVIDVRWTDNTDEGSIYNGDMAPFTEITTDDQGYAKVFNFWPTSDNGLFVLQLSVRDAASDIATELTTGWWEDDLMGCSYCGTPTINVWGHWSYTVEFQRDASSNEICVVENDHAGMSACGEPRHVHHDPAARACHTVVAP